MLGPPQCERATNPLAFMNLGVRRTRIAITEAPLVPLFPAHCALLYCDKVYPTLQLSAPISLIFVQCLYRHCVCTPTRASGLTICVLLPTRASLDEGNEGLGGQVNRCSIVDPTARLLGPPRCKNAMNPLSFMNSLGVRRTRIATTETPLLPPYGLHWH